MLKQALRRRLGASLRVPAVPPNTGEFPTRRRIRAPLRRQIIVISGSASWACLMVFG